MHLDLLGAPAGISITHVVGRLNRRDELHDDVGETSEEDETSRDVVDGKPLQAQAANEDVDCTVVSGFTLARLQCDVQIPRPMKLNKNEAYFGR